VFPLEAALHVLTAVTTLVLAVAGRGERHHTDRRRYRLRARR
jgi:hypothetical protein